MRSKSIKDYEVIIVSVVHTRDGMGIEVWQGNILLIEIFRDDGDEKFTFSIHENDLPLELIAESISHFKKEISSEFQ